MSNITKVSVVISAFNEEKKIGACLDSVKWADEIVVVDNSSTDKTGEIARKYTKKVYTQKNDPQNIDIQKNYAIEKATGDWILILDADEEVSKELAEEIRNVLESPSTSLMAKSINGFWIPRKNIIFGKWIQHTGWYPDHLLRLIRKGKGKYQQRHYHEQIKVEGQTEKLKEHIIHYNYETINQFLYKSFIIYTPNEAEEKIRQGYVFSYKDAIAFPFNEFLSRYFAREGYKDGFHGLVLSIFMAMYHFAVFAYIWEKKKFVDEEFKDVTTLKKELAKSGKEINFWFAKKTLDEEKNAVKKIRLKIKEKLHL